MFKFNIIAFASSLLLAVVYSKPQGIPLYGWPEPQQINPINYQQMQPPRFVPMERMEAPKPQPFKPVAANVPQSKLGTGRHFVQPATLAKASSENLLNESTTNLESRDNVISGNLVVPSVNVTSTAVREATPFDNRAVTIAEPTVTTPPSVKVSDEEAMIATGIAMFGATLGRNGCAQKAACYAATLLPPVKGKEMIIMAAETIVPEEWRSVYQAAKSSVMQKQDCNVFKCF